MPIYLDHHSTTPIRPEVLEAMRPYLTAEFGNASSGQHSFGWRAAEAVEKAREQVASLIGAQPKEITFTSGATESNALAIRGYIEGLVREDRRLKQGSRHHMITSNVEHKAVLDNAQVCHDLYDVEVSALPVATDGSLSPDEVLAKIKDHTRLISIIWANNEIGTLNPVADLADRIHKLRPDIVLHSDAVQAGAYVEIDMQKTRLDMLSLSAHKMYGPKGVGALYLRKKSPRLRLSPQFVGGGQELGLRSGTLNVAGIVGMGTAAELVQQQRVHEAPRLAQLRNHFAAQITAQFPFASINGPEEARLPNNLSVTFKSVDVPGLLADLMPIAALSTGSACASQTSEPSHVLKAIGLSDEHARQTIRFGLGFSTTAADLDKVLEGLARFLPKRKLGGS
jgi:cysteine desulfurase